MVRGAHMRGALVRGAHMRGALVRGATSLVRRAAAVIALEIGVRRRCRQTCRRCTGALLPLVVLE